jgi:hypothetical protein
MVPHGGALRRTHPEYPREMGPFRGDERGMVRRGPAKEGESVDDPRLYGLDRGNGFHAGSGLLHPSGPERGGSDWKGPS